MFSNKLHLVLFTLLTPLQCWFEGWPCNLHTNETFGVWCKQRLHKSLQGGLCTWNITSWVLGETTIYEKTQASHMENPVEKNQEVAWTSRVKTPGVWSQSTYFNQLQPLKPQRLGFYRMELIPAVPTFLAWNSDPQTWEQIVCYFTLLRFGVIPCTNW